MKRNDLMTAVTVAMGTAAVTITGFWPDSLDAGDEPQPLPPKIAQPTLLARGIELAVTTAENSRVAAGEEPVFELVARNTNSGLAQATVRLTMTATSPADALSRVVRTPAVLWQHDESIALAPGERKTVTLRSGAKLPPNNLISVLLQETGSAGQPLAPAPEGGLTALVSPARNAIEALSLSTVVRKPGSSDLIAHGLNPAS